MRLCLVGSKAISLEVMRQVMLMRLRLRDRAEEVMRGRKLYQYLLRKSWKIVMVMAFEPTRVRPYRLQMFTGQGTPKLLRRRRPGLITARLDGEQRRGWQAWA